MNDPVVAPSGYTHERVAIEEHLRKKQSDPLTQEKTTIEDLRPNRSLKEAIISYKKENNIN